MQVEQRARAPRDEATERRRRQDVESTGKRLGVDPAMLDHAKFAYRWVNDAPARLFQMTSRDDWDVVKTNGETVKSDNTDLGDAVSIIVGTKPDGSAMRAYLCRKPRRYHEDDRQKKQTDLDEQLSQLRRGNTAAGEEQGDYIPSAGIRIARS